MLALSQVAYHRERDTPSSPNAPSWLLLYIRKLSFVCKGAWTIVRKLHLYCDSKNFNKAKALEALEAFLKEFLCGTFMILGFHT